MNKVILMLQASVYLLYEQVVTDKMPLS